MSMYYLEILVINWDRRSLDIPKPARMIRQSDKKTYTFLGGGGNDMWCPDQTECDMIAQWLDAQGLIETPLTLTAALDAAKEWIELQQDRKSIHGKS